MIPKEFLCIVHQVLGDTPYEGVLAHQIDVIRRSECGCDMEVLWLWYDLFGFQYDEIER